ncbi:MAG: hypothetical protein LUC38_07750 [Oscillospiraceae bacterium]|nr:hypothetical protein [Ruminococcus sp.]MCD8345831.1 hypothetical protein [Oscillospiraceae bacterium]
MGQNGEVVSDNLTERKYNTPYDDVFRTLLNDCKMLLLPVLNEIFGENYTGNEQIVYSKNEHFMNRQDGIEEERITDASFTVIGEETKKYLFECQSNPDSSMLVRIFEYATQIALDEGEIVRNTLEVTIPNSAVLYLRSTKSTPDKLEIKINTPGGTVAFDVLVMKIREYGLDDIFEKNLLFLIPFYIFNFGTKKQLEELENDSTKLEALKKEYEYIVRRLNELNEQGKLSAYYYVTIIEMSGKVVESLTAQYEKVLKGVKDVMGGTVLDYKAKDIYEQGKKDMAISLHESGVSEDLIAKAANVSVDLVRKWLGISVA